MHAAAMVLALWCVRHHKAGMGAIFKRMQAMPLAGN